jgi:uncharacterized protein (DUF302 family)
MNMKYYIAKQLRMPFDQALETVKEALKTEGFGVLTEVDVQATMKTKLDVDFRKYQILGACNPPFAHRALRLEDKIGLMLPCNVIVQQTSEETVEVAAIDPVASMQAVDNKPLSELADEVRQKLANVIDKVKAT